MTSERRRMMLPVLLLVMASQAMLLSSLSSHRYYGSGRSHAEMEREVMSEHYRTCPAYWAKSWNIVREEAITCIGDDHESATVYLLNDKWIAYGWGLRGGEYATKEQAKAALAKQIELYNQKPPMPKMSKVSLWR